MPFKQLLSYRAPILASFIAFPLILLYLKGIYVLILIIIQVFTSLSSFFSSTNSVLTILLP